MTTINISRVDLIHELEKRRRFVEERDARVTAEHKAAEKAALTRFRQALRDFGKLSYEELLAHNKRHWGLNLKFDPPACPVMKINGFERLLASLRLSKQVNVEISPTGKWAEAYSFLMIDVPKVEGPC